jgi:hypothetical protein
MNISKGTLLYNSCTVRYTVPPIAIVLYSYEESRRWDKLKKTAGEAMNCGTEEALTMQTNENKTRERVGDKERISNAVSCQ